MIIEYHRPETLEAALELMARPAPRTLPLGGGTVLNCPCDEPLAVVDLQALKLDGLYASEKNLVIGATVTLARLAEQPELQPELAKVIGLELNYNLRQAATTAGALVSAGGRSGFAAAMLALDAELEVCALGEGGRLVREKLGLGDLLPLRGELLRGKLITHVTLPWKARLAYEMVTRTPADLPSVCVATAKWQSGRTRLVVGGFGKAPALAMDGPEDGGAEAAAQAACRGAEDEWGSAEYRTAMAGVLARRCLDALDGK